MNKTGYRRIFIEIPDEITERLEILQQNIIESNTGEEAIDAGQVPNFTAMNLLNMIIKVGTDEIQRGRYDIVYNEHKTEWELKQY